MCNFLIFTIIMTDIDTTLLKDIAFFKLILKGSAVSHDLLENFTNVITC